MRSKKLFIGLRAALAMFAVALLAASTWAATEKKLHNFGRGIDGANPNAGLIFDAAGNLYGTTTGGGDYGGYGTVFELSLQEDGGWTEKKLHSFGNGRDGIYPFGRLIFDAVGNLYGTTRDGGTHGSGTVFKLTPNGSGGWTERVLHNFAYTDGEQPYAGLIFDVAGNLYGTTYSGGAYGTGTVFELTSDGSGHWTEKLLHSFNTRSRGDYGPQGDLIFDAAGNLYGTTSFGGDHGGGTVFELTPNEDGSWTEKKLHNFGINGTDGIRPSTLIFDATGDLYGTTVYGGDYLPQYNGGGTVFKMIPNENGSWTEKKLHSFGINPRDGFAPRSLVFDSAGNLYGTTYNGGDYRCFNHLSCGTVFELTPNGSGGWTESKLHNFGIDPRDGAFPISGLVFDAAGNLYGTTTGGGDYTCLGGIAGTVFEITP